jgi:hypothetical protein
MGNAASGRSGKPANAAPATSAALRQSSRSQMKRLLSSVASGLALEDAALKARYEALAENRAGKVTRAVVLGELLALRLNAHMERRFFEAISGAPQPTSSPVVELALFARAVVALERVSRKETRRIAFIMFDPLGRGRIRKQEFRRALLELGGGAALTEESKALAQAMTDSAFAEFCSDEKLGMTFEEWLDFASGDPETCKLLMALRSRKNGGSHSRPNYDKTRC